MNLKHYIGPDGQSCVLNQDKLFSGEVQHSKKKANADTLNLTSCMRIGSGFGKPVFSSDISPPLLPISLCSFVVFLSFATNNI